VPAFTGFDFKAEGRYDKYSTGNKAFSPKFELQYRPISQLKLRGTWSRGFRIPSFNESSSEGVPTTGYISASVDCTSAVYAAFCAAHASNPSYYTGGYTYGLSSVGNPRLKPEKSTSWTAGAVIEPSRQLTITVDYWHTKIKDIILPAVTNNALIAQYYENNGVVTGAPPGVTLIPGIPDPENPAALPLLGFLQSPYTNAASEVGSGVDLSATGRFRLTDSGIRLISTLSASYLAELTLTDPVNGVQKYAGTLSPCNITSCSGAPRWRAQWTNTLDFNGNASITATAYYTSGYSEISTDYGGIIGDCPGSTFAMSAVSYPDNAPMLCRSKAIWDIDLTGQVKLMKHLTLYGNVLNIFDIKPPFDPNAAYGLYNFNPAWADRNFVGRYFRIGAKVDF
jgi:iron complex outermembrane receptor protein